jgi:hypothetical protein
MGMAIGQTRQCPEAGQVDLGAVDRLAPAAIIDREVLQRIFPGPNQDRHVSDEGTGY